LIKDGYLHHLEDYYGHQQSIPEGVVDDYTVSKINAPGPDIAVASRSEIAGGKRLDFIPEHALNEPVPTPAEVTPALQQQIQRPQLPSVWHYQRAGHDRPHILESQSGRITLDGNHLTDEESQLVLDNIKNKAASIRYVKSGSGQAIAKMEQVFVDLKKADEEEMELQQAFRHMRDAAGAGHIPQAAVNALRRQIYTDPMARGLGNKYAWNEFQGKAKAGVYISMDGNDFKAINDQHGHGAGDSAIKAFGQAAREAMDEAVGSKESKLFRNPDEQNLYRSGGDEFVAHVPSHDHAARFARALRSKLEQIPPVAGTHKLSMSFGFGNDYDSADKALNQAKEQKYTAPPAPGQVRGRKWDVGQAPSLAHSHVPGFEGPISLDPEHNQPHPPQLNPQPQPLSPAMPRSA
jgi:GGDEF domain-containing protein